MLDLVREGQTWDEVVAFSKMIEAENAVDILNLGIGWHEARVPTIATTVPHAAFSIVGKKLKKDVIDFCVKILFCANFFNFILCVETKKGEFENPDCHFKSHQHS